MDALTNIVADYIGQVKSGIVFTRSDFLTNLFDYATEERDYAGPTADLFNTAENMIKQDGEFEEKALHPWKLSQGIYD